MIRAIDEDCPESELYEGVERALGYPCDLANGDDPDVRAYYFCPQGRVSATWELKLRDLDSVHDSDWKGDGHPRNPPHGKQDGVGERAEEEAGQEVVRALEPRILDRLRGMFKPCRHSLRWFQRSSPACRRKESC